MQILSTCSEKPSDTLDKHAHTRMKMMSLVTQWEKYNWMFTIFITRQWWRQDTQYTSHFKKSYAIHQEVQTSCSLRSSYLSFGSILLQIDAVASAVSNDSPLQMQNQCVTSRGNRRCREQHGEKHVVPNKRTSEDIFSCEDTSSETGFVKWTVCEDLNYVNPDAKIFLLQFAY